MSKKHIHKYHRVDTGAGQIWACSLPDCSHFMPAHFTQLLPGKASICWGCGMQFILTLLNMNRPQPICPDCEGLEQFANAGGVDQNELVP